MRINRYHRRMHDPWSSRNSSMSQGIFGAQWKVGMTDDDEQGVQKEAWRVDRTKRAEWTFDRFVLGPHSVESLRR